ncbi:hypothetical protein [uncultured Endozoicomonas sp.]|uniref:hypothetical protein n=1 Tax=uncultured Endozoicomonas sp. TaxID=432652 RepID=UPI00260C39E6|nr:hypothetical protein [uncultured Endozoicomonas sp.]
MINLQEQQFADLHYVLGISYSHCLFGKAVIRVDDQYYDPTDSSSSGFQLHDLFVSIYEMPVNDLIDFMVKNNNELPSILNLKVLNLKVVEMLSQ